MGLGARLLLHREAGAEHRGGRAGVRRIRTESQSRLGPAAVHPRIYLSLYRALRVAEVAGSSVQISSDCDGTSLARRKNVMSRMLKKAPGCASLKARSEERRVGKECRSR